MTDTTNGADLSASDDFAAFEASIDNPSKEPAPEAAQPEPEPQLEPEGEGVDGEPAADPEPEAEPEASSEPKPKKTAQQRIDELTWKAAEAERREAATQKRLEEALAGKNPAAEAQAAAAADGEPDPNDYEFGEEDAAYIRDQARFEARQEFEAERRQEQASQALAKSRESFNQRKAEAFPDGDPEGFQAFCKLERVPAALNDIIMVSELGPQLAAHYGANQNELDRLSAMPLHLQAYEISKVEGRLAAATAAPAPAETPIPKPKIATDAPSPAPQVRGAGGQFKVAADTDDFAAFEKAYP